MLKALKCFLLILPVWSPFFCFAQTDTIYYDIKWHITGKENLSYFRTATKDTAGRYKVEDHFMDGKLQMSGYCMRPHDENDEGKNGYFVYYDSAGNKTSEGDYKNSKRSGEWKYYFGTHLLSERNYSAGELEGSAVYYDSFKNVKRSEGKFYNSRRTGEWKFYNVKSGQLLATENYQSGLLEGEIVSYDSLQHKTAVRQYKAGLLHGISKYYENDSLLYEVNYKNGLTDGKAVYYDSALHTKLSEGYNERGKRIGSWTFYNAKTGKIRSEESYVKGISERHYIEYNENGTKATDGRFKNKHAIGTWTYYFADGSKRGEIKYDRTGAKGDATLYDSLTHELITEGSLKNYFREGLWNFYYGNGERKSEEYYSAGLLDGKFIMYDSSGYKYVEGNYENNSKKGSWKYYFERSNDLWINAEYDKDSISGSLTTYYRNGSVKRKERYNNGNRESGTCYGTDGTEEACSPFYSKAKFKGDVMTYIGKNLVYPERAKEAGIEGKVLVGFNINTDGSISDINVVNGIGYGCDEAAKSLIAQMPNWIPEQLDGRYLQTYYTLPIAFWLH